MRLLHNYYFGFKAQRTDMNWNIWAGKLQIGLVMEVLQKLSFISSITS